MTQAFDLKINGESVPIKNGRLIVKMDSPEHGFTADIIVNRITQPDLYEAIRPFRYTPVTVSIENELKLTGKLTNPRPTRTQTEAIYSLAGFSNPFNFIDSALTPSYIYTGQNLHQLATETAKQTNTKVDFNVDPGGIFSTVTATPGQSAFKFLNPLAKQRNQIIGCTPEGAVLFDQANVTGVPVGSIVEGDPKSLLAQEYKISFDGRKRFKTYKAIGRTPLGPGEGTATDENINQPRHKVISASSQVSGGMSATAEYHKNLGIIESLTFPVPVIGWRAPDKSIWKPNTLVSIQSETMFIPDGFTFLIRQVEFIQDGTTKTAVLHVIPPNVYTNNAVVEPWFS